MAGFRFPNLRRSRSCAIAWCRGRSRHSIGLVRFVRPDLSRQDLWLDEGFGCDTKCLVIDAAVSFVQQHPRMRTLSEPRRRKTLRLLSALGTIAIRQGRKQPDPKSPL